MALLAIMVIDIQREYRFYSEKVEIRLQTTWTYAGNT